MSLSALCPKCGQQYKEANTAGNICGCSQVGHYQMTPAERKHSIEDLERMMDLGEKVSIEPDGRITTMPQFKFAIHEKVHNTAYGYNAVIVSRMYVEDADGSKNIMYDVTLWESTPPTSGADILECFLEKGHRIE